MYSIVQLGETLDPSKYTIDLKTKTFSTEESYLVLDFSGERGWTFITGSDCNFITGPECNFYTRSDCTFDTRSYCNFKTGSECTFDTGWGCIFTTRSYCNFDTSSQCTFDTGPGCTFKTGSQCLFTTGSDCNFNTRSDCVIIRRDIFEVIQPEPQVQIKLNGHRVLGYKIIPQKKIITIDGKDIVISEDSFEELKRQLTGE